MTRDFFNLSYLKTGSEIQQKGFKIIQDLKLMDVLQAFNPVLAGTLPLDLFTTDSDLDILCSGPNLSEVEMEWKKSFKMVRQFEIKAKKIQGVDSLIAKFQSGGFKFELFAQEVPTNQQAAYVHMINEFMLLQKYGQPLRDKVLALKQNGIKTEPAFARALGLPGDPYEVLLHPPL